MFLIENGKSRASSLIEITTVCVDCGIEMGASYDVFRIEITVVVDKLIIYAYFILVKTNYSFERLAEQYILEVVQLHGVPLSIISNRDLRFTFIFWGKLHEALGTKLHFSTTFHP
ncbi:integrase [Gossypium australe]|uniref:Integrase n=1 Tax=Gossypium australe TaxID=47621 RepID=A0A5B6WPJ2_9ROSI|nr:integrase [Gossypium australe]